MRSAGARKTAVVSARPSLPGSAEGGGAATTGGSAVIIPPLTRSLLLALLVGRSSGRLELLLDARDVLRVAQELLEQAPLTLTGRTAERRRLLVGHVEDHRLRGEDRRLARLRDRVRIDARRHVLVARAEAALLRPDLGGLRGGEVLHERLDRLIVTERHEQVARDLDGARPRAGLDRREREHVEPRL